MATLICTHCGYEGIGTRILRGSKGVEMFLWTFLIVPGPFYSLWRRGGRSKDCPNCHMPTLVKLNSDIGWLTKRKFDMQLGLMPGKEMELADMPKDVEAMAELPKPVYVKKPVDPDAW